MTAFRIGDVGRGLATEKPAAQVWCSPDGVQVESDARILLHPIEARNYAALLVRAADEVERLRDRAQRERRELEGPR